MKEEIEEKPVFRLILSTEAETLVIATHGIIKKT